MKRAIAITLLSALPLLFAQQAPTDKPGAEKQSMPMHQMMMKCQQQHQQMTASMEDAQRLLTEAAAANDLASAKKAIQEAQAKLATIHQHMVNCRSMMGQSGMPGMMGQGGGKTPK
jgi:hypothetical protein